MPKITSSILWPIVVLVIAFGAFYLKPWNTKPTETISVSAQGKAEAVPDVAKITAIIESKNQNVDQARQETEKKTSTTITELKSVGVEEKDIKTQNISSGPIYEIQIYPAPDKPTTNMYSVNLEIKIRNFDIADEVLVILTKNGLTNLYGPELTLSDEKQEEAKSKARDDAVENARKKAEQLARASGRKLGKVVKIAEDGDFGYPVPILARGEADLQSKASQIQPGQDEVTIALSIDFELK